MNPDFDGSHGANGSARSAADAIVGRLPEGHRHGTVRTAPGKPNSRLPDYFLTYANAQTAQDAISLTLRDVGVARFFHTHTLGQYLELLAFWRPRKQQLHDTPACLLGPFAGNINDNVAPHRVIAGGD